MTFERNLKEGELMPGKNSRQGEEQAEAQRYKERVSEEQTGRRADVDERRVWEGGSTQS